MNIFIKRQIIGCAVCAALFITNTIAFADIWEMPTPFPDHAFQTLNLVKFANDVQFETDGDIVITLHTAGSLYDHQDIKDAVSNGKVPIGEFFMSLLADQQPVFAADTQPFLATSYEEAFKLWAAQKPIITKLLDKQGMIPLFSVPWAPQGLFTKKDINTVADMQGIKLRTYNVILEKLAHKLGADPTKVDALDVPSAFSSGVLDAMTTSAYTGVNISAWRFVNNFINLKAWLPKNIVVVNKNAFYLLDKNVQEALLNAGRKAEKRGWKMSREEADKKIKAMSDRNMNVITPSEELIHGFKTIGNEMVTEWVQEGGAECKQLINAYTKEKKN